MSPDMNENNAKKVNKKDMPTIEQLKSELAGENYKNELMKIRN